MEEKLHLRMSKEVRLNSRVLLLWAYHLKALRPAELIEPVVHSFCRLLSSQSSHTDTHTQSAYKELGHRSLKCVSLHFYQQEVEYVKEEAKMVYLLECLQKTPPPVSLDIQKQLFSTNVSPNVSPAVGLPSSFRNSLL